MERKQLFVPLIVISAIAFVYLTVNLSTTPMSSSEGGMSFTYHGVSCVGINQIAEKGECSHNTFTYMGRNLTRQVLQSSWDAVIDYVAVGNETGTAQAPADVSLQGEYTTHCSSSLARAVATIRNQTASATCDTATCPGNWTMTYEWTVAAGCRSKLL